MELNYHYSNNMSGSRNATAPKKAMNSDMDASTSKTNNAERIDVVKKECAVGSEKSATGAKELS